MVTNRVMCDGLQKCGSPILFFFKFFEDVFGCFDDAHSKKDGHLCEFCEIVDFALGNFEDTFGQRVLLDAKTFKDAIEVLVVIVPVKVVDSHDVVQIPVCELHKSMDEV